MLRGIRTRMHRPQRRLYQHPLMAGQASLAHAADKLRLRSGIEHPRTLPTQPNHQPQEARTGGHFKSEGGRAPADQAGTGRGRAASPTRIHDQAERTTSRGNRHRALGAGRQAANTGWVDGGAGPFVLRGVDVLSCGGRDGTPVAWRSGPRPRRLTPLSRPSAQLPAPRGE